MVIPARVSVIFSEPLFQFIQGVSSACNNRNYSVMLGSQRPKYERRMISGFYIIGLVDGVVVAKTLMNNAIVNSLFESKMHHVDRAPPNHGCKLPDVDNLQAGGKRRCTFYILDISG